MILTCKPLSPLHPRMLWAFTCNWPSGSEEENLKFRRCIFAIISPWNRRGLSIEQTWIPITQGWFVLSSVEIGPMVLEKKMKMWKVYRQTERRTDRQTDDRWANKTNSTVWVFLTIYIKLTEHRELHVFRSGLHNKTICVKLSILFP